jgi:hypothetical protein
LDGDSDNPGRRIAMFIALVSTAIVVGENHCIIAFGWLFFALADAGK